jgi:hypothetical protein
LTFISSSVVSECFGLLELGFGEESGTDLAEIAGEWVVDFDLACCFGDFSKPEAGDQG